MHTEHYIMPQETADLINETKKNGKRVISVGTTSCRTLESVATKNGCIVQTRMIQVYLFIPVTNLNA